MLIRNSTRAVGAVCLAVFPHIKTEKPLRRTCLKQEGFRGNPVQFERRALMAAGMRWRSQETASFYVSQL